MLFTEGCSREHSLRILSVGDTFKGKVPKDIRLAFLLSFSAKGPGIKLPRCDIVPINTYFDSVYTCLYRYHGCLKACASSK